MTVSGRDGLAGWAAPCIIGGAGHDTCYGRPRLAQFHFARRQRPCLAAIRAIYTAIDGRPRSGERLHIARDINGTGVTSTADLLARLSDDDAGQAVLDLSGGHSVTFLNYSSSWFITSDFVIF